MTLLLTDKTQKPIQAQKAWLKEHIAQLYNVSKQKELYHQAQKVALKEAGTEEELKADLFEFLCVVEGVCRAYKRDGETVYMPYKDSVGLVTIGVGFNMEPQRKEAIAEAEKNKAAAGGAAQPKAHDLDGPTWKKVFPNSGQEKVTIAGHASSLVGEGSLLDRGLHRALHFLDRCISTASDAYDFLRTAPQTSRPAKPLPPGHGHKANVKAASGPLLGADFAERAAKRTRPSFSVLYDFWSQHGKKGEVAWVPYKGQIHPAVAAHFLSKAEVKELHEVTMLEHLDKAKKRAGALWEKMKYSEKFAFADMVFNGVGATRPKKDGSNAFFEALKNYIEGGRKDSDLYDLIWELLSDDVTTKVCLLPRRGADAVAFAAGRLGVAY